MWSLVAAEEEQNTVNTDGKLLIACEEALIINRELKHKRFLEADGSWRLKYSLHSAHHTFFGSAQFDLKC